MYKKFKNENIIFFFLVVILILNIFFLPFKNINAEWIEQTNSGVHDWRSIDSSSDGTKLVASVWNGYIYTSSDSGFTWVEQTNSGVRNWRSVSSSSDGTKLVAIVTGGYIYTSPDGGVTWVEQTDAGMHAWRSVSSSSDGTKLVVVVWDGYIYTSTDSGITWIEQIDIGMKEWMSSAVSPDGTTFFAAAYGDGGVYVSTNNGETWIKKILNIANPTFIKSSYNGLEVVVATFGDWPYVSYDTGDTWVRTNVFNGIAWRSAAISYDGIKIIIAENNSGGYIYFSADGGITWTRQVEAGFRNWSSVVSSSDGNKIAASDSGGYIYTYNTPPIASDIFITGTAENNQTLTGSYSYSDSEGDLEGTSTFQWLRDDVEIEGATSLTYTTTQEDVGHTLKFEVTPVALSGELTGLAVISEGLLILESPKKHSSTGSYIKPINLPVVSLPTTSELGCEGNSLFNSQNGQPCPLETSTPNHLNFIRTLKLTTPRMTGQDVKDLQKYLNSKGYDAGIEDGVFGSKKTKQAVINFQLANGLNPDGAVGSITRGLMFNTN